MTINNIPMKYYLETNDRVKALLKSVDSDLIDTLTLNIEDALDFDSRAKALGFLHENNRVNNYNIIKM